LCFHNGSRREKGNRRSSSGQPMVPCDWHRLAHHMWASKPFDNIKMKVCIIHAFISSIIIIHAFISSIIDAYILFWYLWIDIHNDSIIHANNN
jgi:hypothetical protein